MNLTAKPVLLKLLALSAGILGLMLHLVLLSDGFDQKGLLISGYWAGRGLWILTAAMAAGLFLLTRTVRGPMGYGYAYRHGAVSGIGALAAAVMLLVTAARELAELPIMNTLPTLAAAIALIVVGICRFLNRKPSFLLFGILCAFFALRMVSQYRNWNSDPQLLDYVFYLGAHIVLMLGAYQHAAFTLDMGTHRSIWFTGLLGAFLCMVSLAGSGDTWLMLGCAIWSFTNLTSLKIRHKPAASQEEV